MRHRGLGRSADGEGANRIKIVAEGVRSTGIRRLYKGSVPGRTPRAAGSKAVGWHGKLAVVDSPSLVLQLSGSRQCIPLLDYAGFPLVDFLR
ncbi:hypothetical protein I41_24730 [Lacipirellula limnantheis]|uniref:Uncharacterized protein n=1 Tax=Lacipirellula limnantheis TaxID=2528024 RepID=A0A517TY28_9BACT|nr:hypothetical protein I41_24730 [Lacipirellula limnantheis]